MTTKELATLSMLSALTILLGAVPNIGIIQIGPVSLTILHIPVIIASILFGVKGGLIIGTIFGITSWVVAVTRAFSAIDLLFVNPLVSILPRALFGLICGVLCSLAIKEDPSSIKCSIISFVSTIIHTVLVYIAIYFCGKEILLNGIELGGSIQNLIPFLLSALTINSLLEAIVAAIVSFILVKSIGNMRK